MSRLKRSELLKELHDLTDCNNHSEAVVLLSKYKEELTDSEEAKNLSVWASFIKKEHDRIGHIPQELFDFRSRIADSCLDLISEYVSEEYAHAIASKL